MDSMRNGKGNRGARLGNQNARKHQKGRCPSSDNGTGHYWLQVVEEVWRCKNCKSWTLLPIYFGDWVGNRDNTIISRRTVKANRDRYCKISRNKTSEMRSIIRRRKL